MCVTLETPLRAAGCEFTILKRQRSGSAFLNEWMTWRMSRPTYTLNAKLNWISMYTYGGKKSCFLKPRNSILFVWRWSVVRQNRIVVAARRKRPTSGQGGLNWKPEPKYEKFGKVKKKKKRKRIDTGRWNVPRSHTCTGASSIKHISTNLHSAVLPSH